MGAYDQSPNARSALVYLLQLATDEGILDLEPGPRTAAEIAANRGSDPARIEVLCATLVPYGILEHEGNKYRLSLRFRSHVPVEAFPVFREVLNSEEKRLHQRDSHGQRSEQTELELLMAEFRSIAREADVESWINGESEPSAPYETVTAGEPEAVVADEMGPEEESFIPDEESFIPEEESFLPEEESFLPEEEAFASEQFWSDPAPRVGLNVRRRAVNDPVRPRAPLIRGTGRGKGFAWRWPLGYGFGSFRFERALRSVAPHGHQARRLRYRLGTLLWIVAAGCLFWAAWDLWGTGIGQARVQEKLRAEFAITIAAPADAGAPAAPSGVPVEAPAPGNSVALMKIPAIDLEEVILEGTRVEDLRRGPGHYIGTALPGKPGNAAIAGHRTTYGAPFFKIGKLRSGDPIEVTTKNGTFTYLVERIYRVNPDDITPLNPSDENLLTLTTCDPPFSAAKRLIVVAKLQGIMS